MSMLMSLSGPAFAASDRQTPNDVIKLREVGPGKYVSVEDSSDRLDNYITATATADSEIYHYNDNQYFILNENAEFTLSEKVQIDTTNFSKNEALFETYEIPDLVQKEIQSVIEEQNAIGNHNLKISVYAPVTESSPYTYNYNGKTYTLKDYITRFDNVDMGPLEETGPDTLSTAKTIGDFIISKTENIKDICKIFGKFATLYDVATSLFGPLYIGSSGDNFRIYILYDRLYKVTHVLNNNLGGYQPGCVSHKVWIKSASTRQVYNGNVKSQDFSVNKEFYSPNFKSPAKTAIRNAGDSFYSDSYLFTTFLGNNLSFSGT